VRLIPLLFPLLLPGAAACAAPPGVPFSRPSPRWLLAERDRALVLEREGPRVEISNSRPEAALGEVVEAEVRVDASPGARLRVRPGRPGVRILGVDGEGPFRVRFTADTPGPGGVVVELED
jgi:hypothetical protein